MRYHILVVDDDLYGRDLVSKLLVADGFDVSAVTNGEDALAYVRARRPDLVLMDLSLAALDGWEVVRRLRADDTARSVPVIALTAHAMNGERQRALACGCNDYVAKPFDYACLRTKIEAVLEGGPGRLE